MCVYISMCISVCVWACVGMCAYMWSVQISRGRCGWSLLTTASLEMSWGISQGSQSTGGLSTECEYIRQHISNIAPPTHEDTVAASLVNTILHAVAPTTDSQKYACMQYVCNMWASCGHHVGIMCVSCDVTDLIHLHRTIAWML